MPDPNGQKRLCSGSGGMQGLAMERPDVRYVKSGDVNIAYAMIGEGPFDIVFVAGWVLTVFESAWEGPAADTLRWLASFARLILFDKRGTGLSDREYGHDLDVRRRRRPSVVA